MARQLSRGAAQMAGFAATRQPLDLPELSATRLWSAALIAAGLYRCTVTTTGSLAVAFSSDRTCTT